MPRELLSKPFGKISIDEKQLLHFPNGLLGFENFKDFALIEEREDSPFKWLQSVDEVGLAFIVIQPELFTNTYTPAIGSEELTDIQVNSLTDAILFVIVTIPHGSPKEMTANLQGPLIINPSSRKAKQIISRDESHSVRASIIEMMEQNTQTPSTGSKT